jgi:hypothetical protein
MELNELKLHTKPVCMYAYVLFIKLISVAIGILSVAQPIAQGLRRVL